MSDFENIFKNLAGEWKLSRNISSGEHFNGRAHFEALEENTFLLSEIGELEMKDGNLISATRQWHWALEAENHLLISYNENPLRAYHNLALEFYSRNWYGNASHLCTPDTYSGAYQFTKNEIRIEQKVTGPKKNYLVSSAFRR